jgi:Xaa-Pro aminopeptidase
LRGLRENISYDGRRRAVLRSTAAANVRAVLITSPEDVSYLSGFTGEDSFLLIGKTGVGASSGGGHWVRLITDGRYAEQARKQCNDVEIQVYSGRMSRGVAAALKNRRVRRLGVQSEHMTLQWRSVLEKTLKGKALVLVENIVRDLRRIKDVKEVRAIQRSIRVAERAFRALLCRGPKGFVGRSEQDVAAELDYRMRLGGAERSAFETIVAAGPHASLPHYRPGKTRIRRGEGLLIDWGAQVSGYCSDLTRVVFLGKIPPKLARIYKVVLRAQVAGIAAIRPAVTVRTPDAAARKVMEAAGYGPQFLHGLGHGLGRAVHESPSLGGSGKMRLRAGMVVTVEPGIYLPRLGGVRIEDDVLVTPDGRRRLSSLPKSLTAMTLQ